MKLKYILIAVGILFLLILATCRISKWSQWSKDKTKATEKSDQLAVDVATDSVKVSLAEYMEVKSNIKKVVAINDSIIKVNDSLSKRGATTIIQTNTKILSLTKAERKHIIDSIAEVNDIALLEDFANQNENDSLREYCETENKSLKKENEALKTLPKVTDKVVAKEDSLQKAETHQISDLKKEVRKRPLKDFFAKTGAFLLAGYGTATTTIIAAIKYSPAK